MVKNNGECDRGELLAAGERVVEMLERVARERGYPDILVVDNGPELRGRALGGWPMITASSSI